MMKTDASAAQIFLVLKKAFLPHLPLNKKNSLKFFRISKNTSSPLPSHPPIPRPLENTRFPTLSGSTEKEHWLDMG